MDGKEKAFEEIKHTHLKEPTRLELKTCERCKYDTREKSLEDKKKSIKSDETKRTIKPDGTAGPRVPLLKMTVARGRFDDVIGWFLEWR